MVTVDNFTALEEIVVSQLNPTIDDSGTSCDDAARPISDWCSDDPPSSSHPLTTILLTSMPSLPTL